MRQWMLECWDKHTCWFLHNWPAASVVWCVRLYGVWCTHSFKSQDFLLFKCITLARLWSYQVFFGWLFLFFSLHSSIHFYLSTFGTSSSSSSVDSSTLSLCEEKKTLKQINKQNRIQENRTPYTYLFMNFTHHKNE